MSYTFEYLVHAVENLLSIFTDVWSELCRPYIIDRTYMGAVIDSYKPVWSYVIPLLGIGFAFVSIILAKKIMFMLVERRDSHV